MPLAVSAVAMASGRRTGSPPGSTVRTMDVLARRARPRRRPARARHGATGPGRSPGARRARRAMLRTGRTPAGRWRLVGRRRRRRRARPSARRRPRRPRPSSAASRLGLEVRRDRREGLGERVGEVAEDVGRVVELDEVVGAGELAPLALAVLGQDLGAEAAGGPEHEPLVVVVHDDQVAELARDLAPTPPRTARCRRASLCWLRSWKSSARSYSASAADSSSSASRIGGWPAAHESAAPAYASSPIPTRPEGLLGRDAGGRPAGRRSRWARPPGRRPRGRPRRTPGRSRPGCRARSAPRPSRRSRCRSTHSPVSGPRSGCGRGTCRSGATER